MWSAFILLRPFRTNTLESSPGTAMLPCIIEIKAGTKFSQQQHAVRGLLVVRLMTETD